jgi:hypothetical protein
MKHVYDRDFQYKTAAQSREPNYLRDKFEAIRRKSQPLAAVKPLIRVKTK